MIRKKNNKLQNELKKFFLIYFRIKNVEVGDLIDVRDPNFVWCIGVIKRVIKKSENK